MPTLNNRNLTSITYFDNFRSMVLVFKIIMVDFFYTNFFFTTTGHSTQILFPL
jgi:hypothetical protein